VRVAISIPPFLGSQVSTGGASALFLDRAQTASLGRGLLALPVARG
jgi:hypothetical protein